VCPHRATPGLNVFMVAARGTADPASGRVDVRCSTPRSFVEKSPEPRFPASATLTPTWSTVGNCPAAVQTSGVLRREQAEPQTHLLRRSSVGTRFGRLRPRGRGFIMSEEKTTVVGMGHDRAHRCGQHPPGRPSTGFSVPNITRAIGQSFGCDQPIYRVSGANRR